ncbi:MAG: 2-polyprenyl-3-methyl-6-methoxy-1,4-benzoquinone monooxygenase [Enterobacterales bacterium]|nr:2-polyprenyl-3-methyl-6-methoxy-1,4-benzoquinone monooxygenase [Enterobacterales bacterium]
MPQFSPVDHVINLADNALRTLLGGYQVTARANPASEVEQLDLSESQRKHSAGLMRINHCGEVCAQALYQGQSMTAKLPEVRLKMEQAAEEENDHLDWCATRLNQLDSHTSLLNPLWYVGSLSMGAIAGLIGDKWSLGFVAETEYQVVRHLQSHLKELPPEDTKSRAIIEQMEQDELHHATVAIEAGGADLPYPIKQSMKAMAKVMTKSVYWV